MTLKPDMANELRHMVRDVLREVMAQRGQQPPHGGAAVEAVRLTTDHELAAFVARLMEPATAEKVRAGQLRFTLGSHTPAAAAPAPAAATLTGVVTEQKIDQLKSAGRLVLAPGAVLTPLARDRARKLGLAIERRR